MASSWPLPSSKQKPKGPITSRFTGPGLALLAPAGDRGVMRTDGWLPL